jgi:FkbM family methyltransferase
MAATGKQDVLARARRQVTGLRLRARQHRFLRQATTVPRDDLIHLGTHGYGGWVVPTTLLDQHSVCYLAGVGEDISFDLALIARFGCEVHAFDPVPKAARFAETAAAHEPRHHFMQVGLWSKDDTLRFHEPAVEGFVSHSATNIHGTTGYFEATVRSVQSLMTELGHDHLDLLKVSAEGSEFAIVDGVLDAGIDVRILCVEIAQPAQPGQAEGLVQRLAGAGMQLIDATIQPWGWKLSFLKG